MIIFAKEIFDEERDIFFTQKKKQIALSILTTPTNNQKMIEVLGRSGHIHLQKLQLIVGFFRAEAFSAVLQ